MRGRSLEAVKGPRYVPAVAGVALILLTASASRAEESPILAAMQDELSRSMSGLRVKDEPPPYFVAYQVDDTTTMRVSARLGAIAINDPAIRARVLSVEVRVGDYRFDSSRFVTHGRRRASPRGDAATTLPLDDDYDAIRREIWIATDTSYKRAVNVFARKNAAFQNRNGTEAIPDFSRETPAQTLLPPVAAVPSSSEWVDRVRKISGAFAASPDLHSSSVTATETRGTRYYLNSEGFKVVAPIRSASLVLTAHSQAADGMMLRDRFRLTENSLQDLPPLAKLIARARSIAARVTAQRVAPLGEEFTGPVLIEGQASAEFLAQALVPLLLSERPPDSDNARVAQAARERVTPFLTRIGLRVFAEGFSVTDTPSLTRIAGRPVPGAYDVDDEGVPARDVSLVENGRLMTLLTGRTPQGRLAQSNGHGRGSGVQAGVIQVQSAQAIPSAELKKKYVELLNVHGLPFGYIVRGIDGQVLRYVVKVTPDGREEPVRGLRFGNVPPSAFRNILEASEERVLRSYRSGDVTVSLITPSLLFEELEIQPNRDILQKPPIVPSPLGTAGN